MECLRQAMAIVLLLGMLVALDVAFNESRVSTAVYTGIAEFVRVSTRTLTQSF